MLCEAVRPGQVSTRKNTNAMSRAKIAAIIVSATGQPDLFRCGLPPSTSRGFIKRKKYRPPGPQGMKGGCSPQNNFSKLRSK